MESKEGSSKRFKMADEKDELSDLRKQLLELINCADLEGENMEKLKELSEEYVSKLSGEMFQTDPIVNRIMKKLGMYSHKGNDGPLEKFNELAEHHQKKNSDVSYSPAREITLSLTGLPVCSPELETFNKLCGPHITKLELQISDLETKKPWSQGAPKFFETVRMLMENVDTLHLKLTDRNNVPGFMTTERISEEIFSEASPLLKCTSLQLTLTHPIDFYYVLKKFPALQKLVLRGVDDGSRPCELPGFFSNLCGVRTIETKTNPGFLNLKTLDTIYAPKDTLRSLMDANFRLENLALNLKSNVPEVDLEECLNEYKDSLITLKVLRSKTIPFSPFSQFLSSESFNSLTELELWGNVVTNIKFLRNTRRLQKLTINFHCFECPYFSGEISDRPNVFQGDIVENSLSDDTRLKGLCQMLKEFVTDCKLPYKSWEKLVTYMPNLNVLEAPLPDNSTLFLVCKRLSNLGKLRLRFGSQINEDGTDGNDKWPYSRAVTKLEFLHTLELEVECGQGRVTNQSVRRGFLKMDSLRSLKLGWTGYLLTDDMENTLKKKIRNRNVELYRSCSKTTPGQKVEKCCQWADFKRDWQIEQSGGNFVS